MTQLLEKSPNRQVDSKTARCRCVCVCALSFSSVTNTQDLRCFHFSPCEEQSGCPWSVRAAWPLPLRAPLLWETATARPAGARRPNTPVPATGGSALHTRFRHCLLLSYHLSVPGFVGNGMQVATQWKVQLEGDLGCLVAGASILVAGPAHVPTSSPGPSPPSQPAPPKPER